LSTHFVNVFFWQLTKKVLGMGKASGHVMKRFIISLTAGDSKVSHLAFSSWAFGLMLHIDCSLVA